MNAFLMGKEKRLIPLKPAKKIEEVSIDDRTTDSGEHISNREKFHHFGYRKGEDDLLEITVSGITLAGGYKKIEFYKSEQPLGKIAVKAIREDEKCDFITDTMSEMIQGMDSVNFLEGLNGGIISISKRDGVTMEFEDAVSPLYIVDRNGLIRLYTCETKINGRTSSSLVVALKEQRNKDNVEFFIDGERQEKQSTPGIEVGE